MHFFLSAKLCLAVPAAVTGTPFLQRDAELESAAPQLDREAQAGKLHITKTMLVKFGRSVNCAGGAKPHTDACRDRIGQTQPRGQVLLAQDTGEEARGRRSKPSAVQKRCSPSTASRSASSCSLPRTARDWWSDPSQHLDVSREILAHHILGRATHTLRNSSVQVHRTRLNRSTTAGRGPPYRAAEVVRPGSPLHEPDS